MQEDVEAEREGNDEQGIPVTKGVLIIQQGIPMTEGVLIIQQGIPVAEGVLISVVSSIKKKACLLACLLENSTKFTQPLVLETYSKPL